MSGNISGLSSALNISVVTNNPATIAGNTTGTGDEDGGAITGQLNVTDAIDGLTNNYPFEITSNATYGTATIDSLGNWSYTPGANFNGTDKYITVTIRDDEGHEETDILYHCSML